MKSRHSKATAEAAPADPLDCLGLRLQALRRHHRVTQRALAEQLQVGQAALSHMERRDDIKLSSLTDYVVALGGQLHVAATFPGAEPVTLIGGATWQPAADRLESKPDADVDKQLSLPSILGPEQLPPSRDVVFSVRPPHAEEDSRRHKDSRAPPPIYRWHKARNGSTNLHHEPN